MSGPIFEVKGTVTNLNQLKGWRQLILALQTTYESLEKFTNVSIGRKDQRSIFYFQATLSNSCVDALTKMTVCPSCDSENPMKVRAKV